VFLHGFFGEELNGLKRFCKLNISFFSFNCKSILKISYFDF